jgi:hypothetical protein
VDFFNDVGPCDAQKIVVPFQITLVMCESISSEVTFFEFVSLNHGAHGAIEYDDFCV